MRPIDGDKIVEIAEKGEAKYGKGNKPRKFLDWPQLKYLVEKCPTLDVAPVKHGHWQILTDYCCVCSVCHKSSPVDYYYCPECGAMMERGDDDGRKDD